MRKSGVLLPIFSLPGKYGIGCFSKEAYRFIDFLASSRQTYWQILPLGPTSYGDSPYQSFSTFAGNPYFISLEGLISEGLLSTEECEKIDFGTNPNYISYDIMYRNRFSLLKVAYHRADLSQDKAYRQFERDNAFWLDDYALYMSVKNKFRDVSFEQWDEDIKMRRPEAVSAYTEELADEIGFYKFFAIQIYGAVDQVKKICEQKGY